MSRKHHAPLPAALQHTVDGATRLATIERMKMSLGDIERQVKAKRPDQLLSYRCFMMKATQGMNRVVGFECLIKPEHIQAQVRFNNTTKPEVFELALA